jgi:hypothetical protein
MKVRATLVAAVGAVMIVAAVALTASTASAAGTYPQFHWFQAGSETWVNHMLHTTTCKRFQIATRPMGKLYPGDIRHMVSDDAAKEIRCIITRTPFIGMVLVTDGVKVYVTARGMDINWAKRTLHPVIVHRTLRWTSDDRLIPLK